MKARIVRIGNSKGVRLPKALLEESGLSEEVDLSARDGVITIVGAQRARAGWAQAARKLHEAGQDRLLEPPTATRFDDEEWKW
jgi:antitoxin MazE